MFTIDVGLFVVYPGHWLPPRHRALPATSFV